MLSLIVAMGENREIGMNGHMPWRLPGDLHYFKSVTMGSTMVMGRKTFQSLPGLLPGRKHIIITRDQAFTHENPQVDITCAPLALFTQYAANEQNVFVIGGAEIYQMALPYCKRLYITHVDQSFAADTFFPLVDYSRYKVISKSETHTDEKSRLAYQFAVYERIEPFSPGE